MLRLSTGLGNLLSPSASLLGWEAKVMFRAPRREGVLQDDGHAGEPTPGP